MIQTDPVLSSAFSEIGVSDENASALMAFLAPLKAKGKVGEYHYGHSVRVALIAKKIGEYMGVDSKALFYSGLLHDVGKALTNPTTLGKTSDWTPDDSNEIKSHVFDGYRMLRGRFDFSAQVIAWHHMFQRNPYPEQVPPMIHPFSKGTEVTIAMYGRILAIADTYDAMHRVNSETGGVALSESDIKAKMFAFHPDQKVLIENLYKDNVLGGKLHEQ